MPLEGQEVHTAADAAVDGAIIDIQQADADARANPEPYEPTPFDDLAKEMGWIPPDQYKGDAANFRGAEDYIKHGVQSTKALKRDLKAVKETADRLAKTSATITERALEKQRTELEAAHRKAVEDGDYAATVRAEREIRTLDAQAADISPETTFAAANPWYGKDDEATAYAVSVSQRLAAQGKGVDEQLEAAATAVRKRFPELFDDQPAPRKLPPPVNAPGSRSNPTGKAAPTFSQLPAAAQTAYAAYAKSMKAQFGQDYTKEEYLADYLSQ
jgi:hypothetical protein